MLQHATADTDVVSSSNSLVRLSEPHPALFRQLKNLFGGVQAVFYDFLGCLGASVEPKPLKLATISK